MNYSQAARERYEKDRAAALEEGGKQLGEEEGSFTFCVYPGYSFRHSNPNKDYGIGSMLLFALLRLPNGEAMDVEFSLDIYPPGVKEGFSTTFYPECRHIGLHRRTPLYRDQQPTPSCSLLNGAPCYSDGVFRLSVRELLWNTLRERGSAALRKKMMLMATELFGVQWSEEG